MGYTVGVNFTDRPQPVLVGQIGAVITALIGIAVAFGVDLSPDRQTALLSLITALVAIVGSIGAWWAKRKVTPMSSPRDDDGTPLVRADDGTTPTGRHHAQP